MPHMIFLLWLRTGSNQAVINQFQSHTKNEIIYLYSVKDGNCGGFKSLSSIVGELFDKFSQHKGNQVLAI